MMVRIAILSIMVFSQAVVAAQAGVGEKARSVLHDTGFTGGLIVEVGCGHGELTAALGELTRGMVQGLDASRGRVDDARRTVRDRGLGGRVSARWFDGRRLPYADNLVNLLVVTDRAEVAEEELLRVLAPLGKIWIDGDTTTKPWPGDIDEWTHYLHGPDNNAVGRDQKVGLPRSIQWKAGPEWGRSHEQLAGMSTAVTAGGRIFYVVDDAPLVFIRFPGRWKLVARDAFNGQLLWEKPIESWVDDLREFRSGPVHLQRRLVAVDDRVYATLGLDAAVTAFDAATGRTLHRYEGTEYTEEIVAANELLYLVVGTSETKRTGPGLFRKGEPEPSEFRYVTAIDPQTGRTVWKHDYSGGEYLLPLTMAVKGDRMAYKTTEGVVCLDSLSGKKLWQTEEPTPASRAAFSAPTLVLADGVVLCADRVVEPGGKPAKGPILWGVGGWNVGEGISRQGNPVLRAYDMESGEELWRTACRELYNAPVDVFVVDGLVRVSSGYSGHELRTGNKTAELDRKSPAVSMVHHRCYRNKATERFLVMGKSGVEMFDWQNGWVGNNSWIRGTCQYGVLPANGLLYAPPDACACNAAVKVSGFFAAAPARGERFGMQLPESPLLVKGPAYGKARSGATGPKDWPMYRCDNRRSGSNAAELGHTPQPRWRRRVAETELTQPVVVGNCLMVAGVDHHAVYALDATSGEARWDFVAGGRIDSSPTIYEGQAIFGSADGWVYSLNIDNGELAWKFRAAPEAVQVGVRDQLESAWPVHGSVMIQNDTVYVTAGRSTYLDGGIVLYRLDPCTGKALSHTVLSNVDPQTGRQTGTERGGSFDMQGVASDLLSGDGEHVFMKHLAFNKDGSESDQKVVHLYSPTGMLKDPWFVRGFWRYASEHGTGWGKWSRHQDACTYGRILCKDQDTIYGYGRQRIRSGAAGHQLDSYVLFAKDKWRRDGFPLIVRAMVVGADNLAVAGTPDVGKRASGRALRFVNANEALAAFQGKMGVQLKILSKEDGRDLFTMHVDSLPVFDGMCAARDRLYVSLQDGSVLCLSAGTE